MRRINDQLTQPVKPDTIGGFLYLLVCADGSYYTGSTTNLSLCLQQHEQSRGPLFTRQRLPIQLVYTEVYDVYEQANQRALQIRGWSRQKKEALMRGQHHRLPELAANRSAFEVASTSSATHPTANK